MFLKIEKSTSYNESLLSILLGYEKMILSNAGLNEFAFSKKVQILVFSN